MPIDMTNYDEDVDLGDSPVTWEMMAKLNKDLKQATLTLSAREIRYLVDFYYSMQKFRISTHNAVTAMEKANEPNELVAFTERQVRIMEDNIKSALDYYTSRNPLGIWARQTKGVGPVITAGMLCHFDITKAPTVGHFYSYAGHNPRIKWNKGEKRPWNGKLKTLLWKMGESFVKVSGFKDAEYGYLYAFRKELEIARNDRLAFKPLAELALKEKNYREETNARKAYEQGKLPDARLHLRATRWAVQIYLSHLHSVWYYNEFQMMPPRPYVFAHLDHVHYMMPPNLDKFPELEKGLRQQFPHATSIQEWLDREKRIFAAGNF